MPLISHDDALRPPFVLFQLLRMKLRKQAQLEAGVSAEVGALVSSSGMPLPRRHLFDMGSDLITTRSKDFQMTPF